MFNDCFIFCIIATADHYFLLQILLFIMLFKGKSQDSDLYEIDRSVYLTCKVNSEVLHTT